MASRIKAKTFDSTKMLLLATSPGGRGGLGVLAHALDRFPRHGGEVLGSFSLPNFGENFSTTEGITNEDLNTKLNNIIDTIKSAI